MKLPIARNTDLVVQDLGKELLVYDLKTNRAFNLNETSMTVYQGCANNQTFEDLKRRHKFSDDLIYFAIDELKASNLIIGDVTNRFSNLSRREVIKKVGLASMIALPIIADITAPTAAQAASTSCMIGCLGPRADRCTGCYGRTINFTSFDSTDGSCTGAGEAGSLVCRVGVNSISDVSFDSIT